MLVGVREGTEALESVLEDVHGLTHVVKRLLSVLAPTPKRCVGLRCGRPCKDVHLQWLDSIVVTRNVDQHIWALCAIWQRKRNCIVVARTLLAGRTAQACARDSAHMHAVQTR